MLCVCNMYFFILFAISFAEVIKIRQTNCFKNYNECKTKHLFLMKKVVTRFDKKIATGQK